MKRKNTIQIPHGLTSAADNIHITLSTAAAPPTCKCITPSPPPTEFDFRAVGPVSAKNNKNINTAEKIKTYSVFASVYENIYTLHGPIVTLQIVIKLWYLYCVYSFRIKCVTEFNISRRDRTDIMLRSAQDKIK